MNELDHQITYDHIRQDLLVIGGLLSLTPEAFMHQAKKALAVIEEESKGFSTFHDYFMEIEE